MPQPRTEEQLSLFAIGGSMYGHPDLFYQCSNCQSRCADLFPGNVCAVCSDLSIREMVEFVRERNAGGLPLVLVEEVAALVTPPLSPMGGTFPPKLDNF